MSDFTFLTQKQFFEGDKLDIFKKRGTKAAVTDFSILLGAYVSDYHVDNDSSLEGRKGYYWTKSGFTERVTRARLAILVIDITTMLTDAMVGRAQLYRSHQSLASPRTERVGKGQKMVF